MLLLPSRVIPRGEQWLYELKFDGFRGLALKDGPRVRLLSRNQRDLGRRFGRLGQALASPPSFRHPRRRDRLPRREGKRSLDDLQNASTQRQERLFLKENCPAFSFGGHLYYETHGR